MSILIQINKGVRREYNTILEAAIDLKRRQVTEFDVVPFDGQVGGSRDPVWYKGKIQQAMDEDRQLPEWYVKLHRNGNPDAAPGDPAAAPPIVNKYPTIEGMAVYPIAGWAAKNGYTAKMVAAFLANNGVMLRSVKALRVYMQKARAGKSPAPAHVPAKVQFGLQAVKQKIEAKPKKPMTEQAKARLQALRAKDKKGKPKTVKGIVKGGPFFPDVGTKHPPKPKPKAPATGKVKGDLSDLFK